VKSVTAFALILGILITPPHTWRAYPLIWTLLACVAVISQLSAWRLSLRAGIALPFTVVAMTLLVTTPGHPIVVIGGFIITDSGLARYLEIVIKSWLAMQVTLLLTKTTDFTDLLRGLRGLGISETLVATLNVMYRYLFILKDESERLIRARASRSGKSGGYSSGGTLLWRAKITGGMVGNLFLRSYERSERIYMAMVARGYDGRMPYTPLPPLKRRDVVLGLIPIICMAMIQIVVR